VTTALLPVEASGVIAPANHISVEEARPDSGPEWDAWVTSQTDATGYHHWGWRTVFANGLDHPTRYLIAREHARIVGVLPLVVVSSRLFGRALSSLPFVNYGGVLATSDAVRDALVNSARDLAARERLDYVVLRHRDRLLPALPSRDHKVTMLLDLAATTDEMWTLLDKKVRNQVRKAEKSALTAVSGGLELLDGFYDVFVRNMRDLGTPVYGRELFAAILTQFPRDARIHLVRLDQQTIAGAFTYAYGKTLEVPSASSLREHRHLCPNHLMYWSMISQAINEGRTIFDFGRSTPNDGTYHFKEQWGARSVPLFWEYALSDGVSMPSEDRHDARYQRRIDAWKQLPVAVTRFIGPMIARYVP
jgi:FemAB-related protein (PEP-CTERM system-associated)